MKHAMILAVLFAAAAPASAQIYKCPAPNGSTVFSDAPCADGARPITVTPASGHAAAPQESAGQRTSDRLSARADEMARTRRIRELGYEIRDLEIAMSGDIDRMNTELGGLQARKARANNTLAGATWEASISQEMQAVTARYQAKATVDAARLEGLQKQREALLR